MEISRRQFIKSAAVQSAVTAAAVLFPGISFGAWKNLDPSSGSIEWKKTPCRFCGTGCGLLVGVSGDRAVAVKGDPNCTVNKGLCCVKGYHSVQILYGKDRVTRGPGPQKRQTGGGSHPGSPRSGCRKNERDHQRPRKGCRCHLWFRAMVHCRRVCSLQAVQRLHRHQQCGSQRPSVHGQCGHRVSDQFRSRRTHGLL